MTKIELFFQDTNFDHTVSQAFEKDILHISQHFQETICAYGLYNEWEGGPDGDWMVSILTPSGRDELDEDEQYATGSWDEFDQTTSPESYELIRDISTAMDNFHDEICQEISEDESDKVFHDFLESIMERCGIILFSKIPLIKKHFSTTDDFFISVAAHEETVEAKKRMERILKKIEK